MRAFAFLGLALQAAFLAQASPVAEVDAAAAALEERDSCSNGAGQCVTYYSDSDCSTALGSFKPTCEGNCFQFASFSSLGTAGTLLPPAGTDCEVFSDDNCQSKIADTGNHIPSECTGFSTARSMRCFYNC
ncbi:hypothetical protein BDY21DRAFT_350258 [Lineolata rhizophorae]|uniref:Uncharacterized protein n=1 Tax=Lineolata rhizophorae TaxID=578093 RepID=A0A6A6NU23_9PEZI|nr:hypothetical protein BDY21DRAFT_350258 [Lineolata rhizophorae]